jgi:hypothetical protein
VPLAVRVFRQPAMFEHAVVKCYTKSPCDVVVAGPGRTQAVRRVWNEFLIGHTRENEEIFKGDADIGPIQRVIAVLALSDDTHQLFIRQTRQMNAGGRRCDFGDRRQFD